MKQVMTAFALMTALTSVSAFAETNTNAQTTAPAAVKKEMTPSLAKAHVKHVKATNSKQSQ